MLGTGRVRLGHGLGSGRGGRLVIGAADVIGPGVVGPGFVGPGFLSPASSAPASSAPVAAAAPGCADVNQATSVTVHRVIHLVEPTRAGALSKTQRDATLVRALFGQLCAAVGDASAAKGMLHCPADFGISYTGTFYDGSQTLAKFVYGASGCQVVSLTADGKTRTTMMLGAASAAAPKLRADMAAVLEVPTLAIAQPVSAGGASN